MTRHLSALLLLAACHPDPVDLCEDFVEAERSCARQALGTTSLDLQPGDLGAGLTCEDSYGALRGRAARGAVALYSCYIEQIDAADCSSVEGYDQAMASLADCEGAPAAATRDPT